VPAIDTAAIDTAAIDSAADIAPDEWLLMMSGVPQPLKQPFEETAFR
jgi:hypothetical protein